MKAVIMCGGAGTRLRPLTEVIPKPLIKILNIPVLEQIINKVISAGITDIYLSLGYKAQEIIDFCERKGFPVQLHYCTEEKPLGTAGGVKNCISQSEEPILVLSGDNVFNIDILKAAEYHRLTDADVTLIGKEVNDPREYGVVIADKEGNIRAFQEKPTWEDAASTLINTGIYLLKGSVLDMIPENEFYDFSNQLFPDVLKRKMSFMCFQTQDLWGDIGEFKAYLDLTRVMLNAFTEDFVYSGMLYTHDYEDNNGNMFTAPVLIGENSKFGNNNRIGPYSVIGKNNEIGNDCTLEDCILGENVKTGDHCELCGCIADEEANIGMHCVIEKNAVLGYGTKIGQFARILAGSRLWPGKRIPPESVISQDMFYESPVSVEPDFYGVSGKAFSQFSLTDALRLGAAIGSVKGIKRIGIGGDGTKTTEIYSDAVAAGLRSCHAVSYHFDRIFKAQAIFYSAYCSLDMFIYIALSDGTVNLSFFGAGGLPVTAGIARKINNNFRFSVFDYCDENRIKDPFRMQLMNVAYVSFLKSNFNSDLRGKKIYVECENKLITDVLLEVFIKNGALITQGGLQFLINAAGTEMYCIENDTFYSSDSIRSFLCEFEMAAGNTVLIGEDAPRHIEDKTDDYSGSLIRITEKNGNANVSAEKVLANLWNFDAACLCVKITAVLSLTGLTLAEALETQPDFAMRKNVVELKCSPAKVRTLLERTGAVKRDCDAVFYELSEKRGRVRMRQLGNASKIKILSEAADMETAKELAGNILSKINEGIIDNDLKK